MKSTEMLELKGHNDTMTVTREHIIRDVSEALYISPETLRPEDNLEDHGMDSVRIMELVEKWRSAGAEDIDFISLAEDQHLSHWFETLDRLQRE
ncbi:MAG: phosphopantetheine-binding protein [Brevibacterium aurantiacum]|nr:phosphopantetheine-binding protein [Brevibacterium aurantiacum]